MAGEKEVLVITVKQPWANLIIFGNKDIENRSWQTYHRGEIFIHAAKQDDKEAMGVYGAGFNVKEDFKRGAIIGSVEITDMVRDSKSKWFNGPIGWVLKNPKPIDPIFCKGKLGLWTYNL